MKKSVWVTALAVGMGLSTLVLARGPGGQRGAGGPGAKGPGGLERLLEQPGVVEELGLNDEQVEQLEDLRYETEKASIPIEADLKTKRLEMRRLVRDGSQNEEAIMALIDDQATLRADLQKNRVRAMLQVRDIVGDDALDQLRQMGRERWQERRGDRQGRRGDRQGRRSGQGPRGDGGGPPEVDL